MSATNTEKLITAVENSNATLIESNVKNVSCER